MEIFEKKVQKIIENDINLKFKLQKVKNQRSYRRHKKVTGTAKKNTFKALAFVS